MLLIIAIVIVVILLPGGEDPHFYSANDIGAIWLVLIILFVLFGLSLMTR